MDVPRHDPPADPHYPLGRLLQAGHAVCGSVMVCYESLVMLLHTNFTHGQDNERLTVLLEGFSTEHTR